MPRVKLSLRHDGEVSSVEVEQGDGPIDAAFWAVEKLTGVNLVCKDYRVRSASLGRDAIGEVNLEVEHQGRAYRGVGASTDTVESTILAMLNAINRILADRRSGSFEAPTVDCKSSPNE
jgi:2-isopropylmalate synthase